MTWSWRHGAYAFRKKPPVGWISTKNLLNLKYTLKLSVKCSEWCYVISAECQFFRSLIGKTLVYTYVYNIELYYSHTYIYYIYTNTLTAKLFVFFKNKSYYFLSSTLPISFEKCKNILAKCKNISARDHKFAAS